MDVLTGGDQQRLRRVLADDRLEDVLEQGRVVPVRGPGGQRHVDREPFAVALAALGEVAAARVVRPLVGRAVEYAPVAVEDRLRTVAVMHVPVQHRHALVTLAQQPGGGDGDVVEEAETHRPVLSGVVARGTDERERDETVVPQSGGEERAAHREQRDLVAAR